MRARVGVGSGRRERGGDGITGLRSFLAVLLLLLLCRRLIVRNLGGVENASVRFLVTMFGSENCFVGLGKAREEGMGILVSVKSAESYAESGIGPGCA